MSALDAIASEATGVTVEEADPDEVRAILDRQAVQWLGMSGDAFIESWRAGKFDGEDDEPAISRLVSTARLLG